MVVMALYAIIIGATLEGLRLASMDGCGCDGESLIYECTLMGGPGGATVWTGSAFDCRSNEITLLHQPITNSGGMSRDCNNGAIVGRILYVEGNLYTSQLNVTVTQNLAGKTIMCVYDTMGNDTTSNIQLSANISGITSY